MTITLMINSKNISVTEGKTMLEAAREHGIEIPTLCYHKSVSPAASCRLCMVEVEGWRGGNSILQPACAGRNDGANGNSLAGQFTADDP